MSEKNVELHRRLSRALNGYDEEALLALCDPSIEVHSVFAAVGGDVYHGHDGVRSWQRDLKETWGGDLRVEPEAFFDLANHTLMFGVQHGRGPQSGAEVAMPATAVAGWREGLCVSHKAFVHREHALRELGVSEDALEPIAVDDCCLANPGAQTSALKRLLRTRTRRTELTAPVHDRFAPMENSRR